MPIPKPKDGESQQDYMGRCMHAIKDEFDSNDQRVAVCLSTFRKHGKDDEVVLTEKFNPNHDEHGRFASGGGSSGGGAGGDGGGRGSGGGRRAGGPGGRKIPKAFTREWFNYWARISQSFGRIAHLLQTALPVVLAAIETVKGILHLHSAVRNNAKATNLQSLIQQIEDMSDAERSDTLNQILDGLSPDEADQVLAAVNEDKAFNPNQARDSHGRWTSGGGASAAGSGRAMVPLFARYSGGGSSHEYIAQHLSLANAIVGIALPVILSAIIIRKGVAFVKNAINKYRNREKQITAHSAQGLADEISACSKDTQQQIIDELLSGLSEEDANYVADQLDKGKSANPFDAFRAAIARQRQEEKFNTNHNARNRSVGPPKGNGAVMETKDFALEVGDVTDKGFFSGYASTYDIDLGQDKVVQGAFTKSLGSRMPLMLWSHDPKSPIGVWNKVAEDNKGLNVEGRILIDQKIPEADKAYALLKAKAIRGLSIGYRVKDAEQEGDVRLLKELELPEISIVSMPMNQNASVSSVKTDELFFKWAIFEDWARRVRDGEVPPIKELENLLREAGVPKSVAVQIASVGYAKTIRRSDSGESDEATTDALTRLKAAVKAFS